MYGLSRAHFNWTELIICTAKLVCKIGMQNNVNINNLYCIGMQNSVNTFQST